MLPLTSKLFGNVLESHENYNPTILEQDANIAKDAEKHPKVMEGPGKENAWGQARGECCSAKHSKRHGTIVLTWAKAPAHQASWFLSPGVM